MKFQSQGGMQYSPFLILNLVVEANNRDSNEKQIVSLGDYNHICINFRIVASSSLGTKAVFLLTFVPSHKAKLKKICLKPMIMDLFVARCFLQQTSDHPFQELMRTGCM